MDHSFWKAAKCMCYPLGGKAWRYSSFLALKIKILVKVELWDIFVLFFYIKLVRFINLIIY